MTKYRLNIKYPISKENSKMFLHLYEFNNSIVNGVVSDAGNDLYQWHIKNEGEGRVKFWCPKSWLEDVEDTEFYKWVDFNVNRSHDLIGTFEKCWQASEKNTHLMYKEFIEKYEDFLHQDYELIDDCAANNKAKEILKELNKIKEQLK